MNSSGGISIIQVTIVSAALLLAGLAGLQLSLNTKMLGETVVASQDISALSANLTAMLQSEDSCRRALGGPPANCFSGANPSSCPVADPGTAQGISTVLNTPSPVRIYHQTGGNVLYSPVAPNNQFGRITITAINLTPLQQLSPESYYALLTVEGRRTGGTNLGPDEFLRNSLRMTIRVRGAGNLIYSCSALSFFGTDQRALPICLPGEGLFMRGAVRCVRMICPVGLTPSGFDPGGNVICL